MYDLFYDVRKMKCTIAEGSFLSSEPYYDYTDVWYDTSSENPEVITRDGKGIYLLQSAYGPYNGQETQLEAKVIVVMQCLQLKEEHWTTKYAVVCMPARATMTNANNSINMRDVAFLASGYAIAEKALGACGMDMRPQHGDDWTARVTCQLEDGPYLAVYPKWLNNFE